MELPPADRGQLGAWTPLDEPESTRASMPRPPVAVDEEAAIGVSKDLANKVDRAANRQREHRAADGKLATEHQAQP